MVPNWRRTFYAGGVQERSDTSTRHTLRDLDHQRRLRRDVMLATAAKGDAGEPLRLRIDAFYC